MLIDHYLRGDLPDVGRLAADLEAVGFDGLYTAEGPHEPFFALALAAETTSRVALFTNIAVAFARSPMDLAQTSDAMQRAAAGRFVLGLGSQIRPHIESRFSMPWSTPVTRMREMVQAIKAIQHAWATGERLGFRGEIYHHTLMTPFFDPGPNPFGPPPIWVAALGPRMTECAGEVGDGLLVHPFHTSRFVREHIVTSVGAGLTKAGRPRSTFTISATPIICTGSTDEEVERAEAGVRRLLGFYGSTPAYRVTLDAHGWGDLQTELHAMTKAGRWEELAAVVPDEVFDTIAVRGAPSEIGSLLRSRYGGDVDRVGLSMPYDASPETLVALVDGCHTT